MRTCLIYIYVSHNDQPNGLFRSWEIISLKLMTNRNSSLLCVNNLTNALTQDTICNSPPLCLTFYLLFSLKSSLPRPLHTTALRLSVLSHFSVSFFLRPGHGPVPAHRRCRSGHSSVLDRRRTSCPLRENRYV